MARLLAVGITLVFAGLVPAAEVVVKAAKVITGAGAPLVPGAVRVKDGKIVEVAASIPVPAGAKEIDLGSGVLMPGLVDAFSMIGIEGGAAESTLEVTPSFRVLDGVDWSSRDFRQALADGITTVALVPGTDNVVSGLSCVVKTSGPRPTRIVKPDHAVVITVSSDPASGNSARNRPDSIYTRQPTNRMGVIWILRNELGKAQLGDAKSAAVIKAALAGQRPVVCISRSESDIAAALALRKEFPFALTLAGGQEAYRLKSELAAAKAPVLLAPTPTAAAGGPEGTELIWNTAGVLHEAGVPIALTGGRLLEQAQWAVRYGLPADAALAAITAVPAKLLGLESRLGTIAPGRDADLIALTGDPFDLKSTIRWTMIDGVIRAEEP